MTGIVPLLTGMRGEFLLPKLVDFPLVGFVEARDGWDADVQAKAVRRIEGDEIAGLRVSVLSEPLDELLSLGWRNIPRKRNWAWFCHMMLVFRCLRGEKR